MSNTENDLRAQCDAIAKAIETGEYGFEEGYEYEYPCAEDYLQSALSIEYVRDSDGEYRGAIVLVAFGGPNIWIDTRWKEVRGAWWGDNCTVRYNRDELGIDEYLEEISCC